MSSFWLTFIALETHDINRKLSAGQPQAQQDPQNNEARTAALAIFALFFVFFGLPLILFLFM